MTFFQQKSPASASSRARGLTIGLLLAGLSFGTLSCTTPAKRTGIGAAGGAGAGAVIGGVAGGWKGAAIGAGVGALAGGAVGNYLDKQAKELEEVAETKRTENGVLVNLKNDLLFDTGRAELKPESQAQVSKIGDILAKYPEDRIRIEGYTDSTGGRNFNQLLSQQRAQAVSSVLIQRGVKPQQIMSTGRGPDEPVAPNSSPAGRAKNRRVELHIDVPPENQG
jgi:outer membrane protein OmpA-like peptidoglycan-associated protein